MWQTTRKKMWKGLFFRNVQFAVLCCCWGTLWHHCNKCRKFEELLLKHILIKTKCTHEWRSFLEQLEFPWHFHSSSKIYGLKAQKYPAWMKLLKEASIFTRKRSILLLNSEAEMSVHTVVSGTEYYITLEALSHRRNKILKLSQRNQPHQHRPIKTQITSSPFSSSACIIQLSISQGKKMLWEWRIFEVAVLLSQGKKD